MHRFIGLPLTLALFASAALAQTSPKPSSEHAETLSIGSVELKLGMQQDVVLGKLTKAGYRVNKSDENFFIEAQGSAEKYTVIGGVSFRDGRLSFINRSWNLDENSAVNLGNALFGVLSNLHNRGRTLCSLQTGSQQNPQSEIKSIDLTCMPGKSYVSIAIIRSEGQESVSVEEILTQE